MKRVGALFEAAIEPENLRLAFWKASRGKRHRPEQRAFAEQLESEIFRLRNGLLAGDYPVGRYTQFKIYDPYCCIQCLLDSSCSPSRVTCRKRNECVGKR